MTIKFTTENTTNVVASVEVDEDGWLLFKLNDIPILFINPENGIAGEWGLSEEESNTLRRLGIQTIANGGATYKINIDRDEAAS